MTRTVAGIAVVAVLSVALGGCSALRRDPTPYDTGIPEARAAAEQQLDELASRVDFSDRVTVLGASTIDDCDTIRRWWFDDVDLGYQCTMQHFIVAAVPAAQSRQDVAAAVDSELVDIDLPIPRGGMVHDLYALNEAIRSDLRMQSEGADGAVIATASAEPFRAEFWPPVPRFGVVSGGWDGPPVTSDDFAATGATEAVVIAISIEYWNTDGIRDATADPIREGATWVAFDEGSRFAFDLVYAVPADGAEACLGDSLIDQASVRRAEDLLAFELLPEAQDADSDRIRACIEPRLTSGTALQVRPASTQY